MPNTLRLPVLILCTLPLALWSCERGSVGGDPNPDGTASTPDAALPPADAAAPGCEPQEAYEDPAVDCDGCSFCDDLQPWQWTGAECELRPICCACAGAHCGQRFRTYLDCEQAYGGCPHDLLEVQYPATRALFWMPGGFAGHGPVLEITGYGDLQTWLYVHDLDNRGLPDYSEAISQREANRLFGLLADVDFTDLPHPPADWFECYPQLWLWWEDAPHADPIVVDYPRASNLLPELADVYQWIDRLLCRGDNIEGYPELLPSGYCMWW